MLAYNAESPKVARLIDDFSRRSAARNVAPLR
jgi:hypothetical protein